MVDLNEGSFGEMWLCSPPIYGNEEDGVYVVFYITYIQSLQKCLIYQPPMMICTRGNRKAKSHCKSLPQCPSSLDCLANFWLSMLCCSSSLYHISILGSSLGQY